MTGDGPANPAGEVVLYWRPGCLYSVALRARLSFSRLRYRPVNIAADPAAAAIVRSVADGDETVPTADVAGRVLIG